MIAIAHSLAFYRLPVYLGSSMAICAACVTVLLAIRRIHAHAWPPLWRRPAKPEPAHPAERMPSKTGVDVATDEPFFVIGTARSGTTMLRLMLNKHSRLCVPRESWFISDLMNALPLDAPLTPEQCERAVQIICAHPRWKVWEITDQEVRNVIPRLRSPRSLLEQARLPARALSLVRWLRHR